MAGPGKRGIMAGKRMVHEEMCNSIKLSKVSADAERLWVRVLTKTDDNGNFHALPALVRGACLPLFDVTLAAVDSWLTELVNVGLIAFYESKGERLLHIVGFSKYQKLRNDRTPTIKHPTHPESMNEADESVDPPASDEVEEIEPNFARVAGPSPHLIAESTSSASRRLDAYEGAREKTCAIPPTPPAPSEVVFVRGTTEAINLVATSLGRSLLHRGDRVVDVTVREHHSNIVPWHMLREYSGIELRVRRDR